MDSDRFQWLPVLVRVDRSMLAGLTLEDLESPLSETPNTSWKTNVFTQLNCLSGHALAEKDQQIVLLNDDDDDEGCGSEGGMGDFLMNVSGLSWKHVIAHDLMWTYSHSGLVTSFSCKWQMSSAKLWHACNICFWKNMFSKWLDQTKCLPGLVFGFMIWRLY